MDYFDAKFWKAAANRAIWTFVEMFAGLVGTSLVLSDVDWKLVLSSCAMATIISFAKSMLVGVPEVK